MSTQVIDSQKTLVFCIQRLETLHVRIDLVFGQIDFRMSGEVRVFEMETHFVHQELQGFAVLFLHASTT
jgi:hypothetical protein